MRQQGLLAHVDVRHAEPGQVVDRGAEADEAGDVGGAGLELVWCVVEHGALETHFLDHLAATEERRHRGEVLAPAPQRAGAGRAGHLVAGDRVKVAADGRDVERAVRRGLRTVDHADYTPFTSFAADVADRIDGAEHVRHVGHAEDFHFRGQQRVQRVQIELAAIVEFGDLDRRAGTLRDQLPRHDVGVVFHAREHDRVAGLQPRQRPGIGDQIDRERGAAAQHQLVAAHLQKCGELAARGLKGFGRLRAQRVHGAADVGVVVAIEVVHCLDHRRRLLPGIGRVEVDQRLAVNLARQHWEIAADLGPVDALSPFPCLPPKGTSFGARGKVGSGALQTHASSNFSSAASSVAVSCSRSLESSITTSVSRQNAAVSKARACSAGRPRERR